MCSHRQKLKSVIEETENYVNLGIRVWGSPGITLGHTAENTATILVSCDLKIYEIQDKMHIVIHHSGLSLSQSLIHRRKNLELNFPRA